MTSSNVYQLSITDYRTYFLASAFVLGNIVVPQLCHLIPQGGLIFLPIYFFTLIAAYKYGFTAGMLTAVCSPVINHLMFGMPPTHMLPIILVKSILLATFASLIANRVGKVTLPAVALSVVAYQIAGGCIEWSMTGSSMAALQDFRLGYPGIILQITLGYIVLINLKK